MSKTKKISVISGKHTLVKHKFYQLTASADYLSFTFQSLSVDRIVPKKIQFVEISYRLYNLAFGDLQHGDEFDDLIVTDNKDTELVLATVVQAVLIFLQNHPDCVVYFTGNTPTRTRLYRIILSRDFINWVDRFEVYGILPDKIIPFEKNVSCNAFIIKMIKL